MHLALFGQPAENIHFCLKICSPLPNKGGRVAHSLEQRKVERAGASEAPSAAPPGKRTLVGDGSSSDRTASRPELASNERLRAGDWSADGVMEALGLGARTTPTHSELPIDPVAAAVEHKGPGRVVDNRIASQVSEQVGRDVGDARIHDGKLSQLATQAVGARAFAYGRDVFLGDGESSSDSRLMAHELTHVAQQKGSPQALQQNKLRFNQPDSPAEKEADHVADAVADDDAGGELTVAPDAEEAAAHDSIQEEGSAPRSPVGDEATERAPLDADTASMAPKSWVGSERKVAKDSYVLGAKYPTFEAVAKAFFGHGYLAPMVAKANPSLKPTRIGPKTKIRVPSSIEIPTKPQLLGDPSRTDSIAYHTWNVERHPKGQAESRTPSVPSSSSGVTIGRGYDMKERKVKEVQSELEAATIDSELAKKLSGGAGKQGKAAKAWIKKNQPFTPITAGEENLLFRQEYQRMTNKTVQFLTDPSRGYRQDGEDWILQVDFASLDGRILAFLVDLRFRGDLKPSSWSYVREPVLKNDLSALAKLVADRAGHKKHFYDNYVRYQARCRIVGATPVTQKAWDA